MTPPMTPPPQWRPLHRRLPDEAAAMMRLELKLADPDVRARMADIHLALTQDVAAGKRQPFRVACDENGKLGEWITGDGTQVTCKVCLETVHA